MAFFITRRIAVKAILLNWLKLMSDSFLYLDHLYNDIFSVLFCDVNFVFVKVMFIVIFQELSRNVHLK